MNIARILGKATSLDAGQSLTESTRYQEALDYLFQRINYERTTDIPYRSRSFKLDRMQALMNALGNPERKVKVIHVAGTKGKGSTSAFLANVLWKAGYQVGKFTSPHLERLEERFWLNGESCSAADIVWLVNRLVPIVQQMDEVSGPDDRLTFFELTTAMGFLLFAERKVDFAVLEVGLGGRLDSTNVCHPMLCLITSISRDHMALLGDTLAQIAGEKAGIIKPGVPVISGVEPLEARQVVAEVARNNQAQLWQLDEDFSSVPADRAWQESASGALFQQTFDFGWKGNKPQTYAIGSKGKHQVANAGLAIASIELLRQMGFAVSEDALRDGLAATSLPARIECLSDRPAIIVDAAHNDASAAALVSVLEEHFPGRRRHLVFASSGDKDHAAVLKHLLGAFDEVWLTKYSFSPRATDPAYLCTLVEKLDLEKLPQLHATEDAKVAFHEAIEKSSLSDVLVVTGSFFIAAEFKRFWSEQQAAQDSSISSAAR